jgi:hypothetical protein
MSDDDPFDVGFARPVWSGRPAGDEEPDRLQATAHQGVDEAHRPGSGTPCYRVVFKTLRIALRDVRMEWPNLRARFTHGTVDTGGFVIDDSLPSRRSDAPILPEFARWVQEGSAEIVKPTRRVDPRVTGWETSYSDVFYVELLLDVEATSREEILSKGRRGIATFVTLIDLTLGQRVLGAVLAEEAGERHDDGHFARLIGTPAFRWEAQLDLRLVDNQTLSRWAGSIIDPLEGQPEDVRRRLSLAAHWYQTAMAAEPTSAFLHFWFVAEVLAMKSSHARELTERLTALEPRSAALWQSTVRILAKRRAAIVHGRSSDVNDEALQCVMALSVVLLTAQLNMDLAPALAELGRKAASITS